MEEILPEPERELQFAAEEEDEPETPTTADLLVIPVTTCFSDIHLYRGQMVTHWFGDNNQGLHEVNPAVAALEESNALALAIIPSGKFQAAELSATFCSCLFSHMDLTDKVQVSLGLP